MYSVHPHLTIFLGLDTILLSRMTLSAEVLRGLNTPPLRFAVQAGSKIGTSYQPIFTVTANFVLLLRP